MAGTRTRAHDVTRQAARGLAVPAGRVVFLAAILALWQWLPKSVVHESILSRPDQVAEQLWEFISSGDFFTPLSLTAYEVFVGVAIGAGVGVALAVLMYSVSAARWLLTPIVDIAYAIPKVILISLFILWFGIEHKSVIAFVVSWAVFIFFYAARQGLAEVDRDQRNALLLLGASRLQLLRLLLYPAVLPSLLTGFRLALPIAYGAAIYGELSGAANGLGYVMAIRANSLDAAGTLAVLVTIAVVGYLLDLLLKASLHRRATVMGVGF